MENKELEEALKCVDVLKEDGCITTMYQGKALETIRQALLELKSIKETNPSETLRKLDIIRHLEIGFDKNGKPITLNDTSGLNTIEKALTTKSKKEQAFDIIVKKEVNIGRLIFCVHYDYDYKWYNLIYEYDEERQLTQEEFDFLKGVLKND